MTRAVNTMFGAYKQGSRLVSKAAVVDYARGCKSNALPSLISMSMGSCHLHFSHSRPRTVHRNISMIALEAGIPNKIGNLTTAVKHHGHQHVTRSCFHTSSCLNSYQEDNQKQEKREAKIIIMICITLLVTVGALYNIDHEEYDKPMLQKS